MFVFQTAEGESPDVIKFRELVKSCKATEKIREMPNCTSPLLLKMFDGRKRETTPIDEGMMDLYSKVDAKTQALMEKVYKNTEPLEFAKSMMELYNNINKNEEYKKMEVHEKFGKWRNTLSASFLIRNYVFWLDETLGVNLLHPKTNEMQKH